MDIKKVSKKGRKLPYITNSQGKRQVFRETIPVGISTLLTNILDCKWSLESWDNVKSIKWSKQSQNSNPSLTSKDCKWSQMESSLVGHF